MTWPEWMKRRSLSATIGLDTGVSAAKRPGRAMTGMYLPLHTYLDNRYAVTVVLTFAEIEDLIGAKLPDLARGRQEWWTAHDETERPSHSDAWTLAGRTAKPNLSAHTVSFERE